ncbi:MAG: HAMP domain-containing sensor histidine kinase [Blautia sp.]|nr:HAMP domain-containing sensor histidine kinase [uncultured Blautia sp.]MDR3892568.1 HAMP domain-containing sensor histidine kinase [Blautia sp.]
MGKLIYFVLVLLCLTSLYFFWRCRTMRGAVRKTNEALQEISREMEENRVLKLSVPDREIEALLVTINDALRRIREQHLEYSKREQEFQRQIENISHDLRTPLTSIIGYLDIMDKSVLSEEDQDALAVVKRKAYFLQQLVGQFYDLSRFSGEDYMPAVENVDIARLLRETVVDYYPELAGRGLMVDINIAEGPVNVRADKGALERVLQNLLQNVCRYAGRELLVRMETEGEKVVVSLVNDAEGMTGEEAERLFERFYMGDGSRNQGSSGLGLTIARCLAEKMGGTIRAEVDEGELTIILTLWRHT